MLTRYLGNKSTLLGPILEEIDGCHPVGRGPRVGDLFAGTLAVSLALKEAGCRVVANDVQPLSRAIGEAFLLADRIPRVPEGLVGASARSVDPLRGTPGFAFLEDPSRAEAYGRILDVLAHLEDPGALPPEATHTWIADTYTAEGRRSAFTSSRGTTGRRRYFTHANGLRIDAALNQIRWWWRAGAIERPLYALLCCALMRAVEKVSNTQGTYHDFPRDSVDSRALKPLRFEAPPMDTVLCGGAHELGCGDALTFAPTVAPLDVLYLDPPYNFRQYTAYYFLPNLLCRYGDLDDEALTAWFEGVRYVRGQNMADDFTSTFCSKTRFLDDLGTLIDRARPRWVVLSYFDGRNHWNDFKRDPNGVGRGLLEDFFASSRFADRARVREVGRTNYQSYGGHRARRVDELLFVARVRDGEA